MGRDNVVSKSFPDQSAFGEFHECAEYQKIAKNRREYANAIALPRIGGLRLREDVAGSDPCAERSESGNCDLFPTTERRVGNAK
jgi:hypothetical protein